MSEANLRHRGACTPGSHPHGRPFGSFSGATAISVHRASEDGRCQSVPMTRRQFLRNTGFVTAGLAVGLPKMAGAATRPLTHGVAAATLDDMRAFEDASGRFVSAYTYYRSWGSTTVNLAWERDLMRQ